MSKPNIKWMKFGDEYLRDHVPDPNDEKSVTIYWHIITQGLNRRIEDWWKKNPLRVNITGKPEELVYKKPWRRELTGIVEHYRSSGLAKLHLERGPAARPGRLVSGIPRYNQETKVVRYPPALELAIKRMVENKTAWDVLVTECYKLGGPDEKYSQGSVFHYYRRHLKSVRPEELQTRANEAVPRQSSSTCPTSRPRRDPVVESSRNAGRGEDRNNTGRTLAATNTQSVRPKTSHTRLQNTETPLVPPAPPTAPSSSRREEKNPDHTNQPRENNSDVTKSTREREDTKNVPSKDRHHHEAK
ncbi:hypothetical protein OCU04_001074 [Sclerotinia nivalis]|uniref:Uncharacterized protein n=1 Tax=Sclerotinia nivalis TaxID=352851 RepID=A0A9X0AYJ7_9HELO|nr:hypothetical protein OCU04_001074 [Sclerotinia nivalis]